nr:hypothetical protein [Tanacetum cinerariifolium]
MKAYKKVHNETVRSRLSMEVVQQSMEIDMWEIIEKLAERREQMAVRAYKVEKRRAEWIQRLKRIRGVKNGFKRLKSNNHGTQKPIQIFSRSDDLTSDPNKKTTEKGVGKEGFGCALNKSKGSHLGLRHCVANRKRKKRKGPFMWTKSKSRVMIEVGQTEAIDGGLN